MKEGKPIVLDDVDLGSTMFWNASPKKFLKTAVDTSKGGTLRILGRVVYLPATPRVFTTNAANLRDFIRLRDSNDIPEEHYEAVARRVVLPVSIVLSTRHSSRALWRTCSARTARSVSRA